MVSSSPIITFSKMRKDDDEAKDPLTDNDEFSESIKHEPHFEVDMGADPRQLNCESSSLISDQLKPLSKEKKLVLAMIVVTDILCFVASGAPAPFFPQEAYLKDQNAKAVGFITSSYHLGALLISPLCGYLVTKVGIKCMFLLGMLVITLATGASSIALKVPSGNSFFIICTVMRFIQGTGNGALQTSLYAFITTEFSDRVSSAAGFLEMAFGVGYALGPLLGGLLYTAGGFPLPFIVIAGLCSLILPIGWFLLPETNIQDPNVTRTTSASKSSLHLLTVPSIYLPLSVVITAMGNLAYIFMAYPLQASKDFNTSPVLMGLLFGIASAEYALVAPLVGYIVDKKGYLSKRQMIIIGDVIIAVAFLFMGPAPFFHIDRSLWQLSLTLVLFLVGQCSAYVPSFGYCVDEASKVEDVDETELKGMISGIMSTISGIGAFIGPVLGGVFLDHFGWSWTSVALASITVVNGIAVFAHILKSRKDTKKFKERLENQPIRTANTLS